MRPLPPSFALFDHRLTLIISSPRDAIGKRIGGLYIAQQFGNAFGGLLAAAVLKMQGLHGLKGWQVRRRSFSEVSVGPKLTVSPSATVAVYHRRLSHSRRWLHFRLPHARVCVPLRSASTCASAHSECYLLLPADPYNAKILSPVERDLAVWRIERETGAAEGSGPTESVVRSFLLHCCGF